MADASAIQLNQEDAEREITLLVEDIDASEASSSEERERITKYREYYRYQREDDTAMFPGASTLVSQYVKSAALAIMSEVAPSLLSLERIPHVEGVAQWADWADEVENFHDELDKRVIPFKRKVKNLIWSGLRDGGAVMKVSYDVRRRMGWGWKAQQQPVIDPISGMLLGMDTQYQPERQELTVYDAPRLDVITLDKFGTIPAQLGDVDESTGCWVRTEITGTVLMDLVRQGLVGKKQVAQLLSELTDTGAQTSASDDYHDIDPQQPRVMGQREEHKQGLTLTQVWKLYRPPGAQFPEEWVFLLHEDTNLLLGARPAPYWYTGRPFVVFRPYDYDENIFGDSLVSAGGGSIQDAKTDLFRLAINCMLRGIDPRMIVPASLYKEIREKFEKDDFKAPGSMIPLPDAMFDGSGRMMTPVLPGYNPQMALALLEYSDLEGQRSVGVSDTRNAQPMKPGTTATELQMLEQATAKLLGQITESAAEAVGKIQEKVHGLVRQYQGRESMQKLWMETTGGQLPMQQAMEGEYVFTANGLSDTNNRAIREKRAIERLSMLSNEPYVMSDAKKRYKLYESVLREHGDRNPQDYLGTEEEWVQRQMMEQQAAQMAMQAQQEQQALEGAVQAMGAMQGGQNG